MPRNPRRRRQTPRRLPPRPGAPSVAPSASAGTASARESRPARLVEREAPYLRAELRRVFSLSAVSLALLALLVIVDRVR